MQPYTAAKQWRDGFGANETRITAADLTHIEDGISGAVQGVTNLETKLTALEAGLPGQVQALLKDLRTQVENLIPVGTIAMYGAEKDPDGWVRCDGRLLDRAAYAKLFATLGTTNGFTSATNFRDPDIRGRKIIGTGALAIGGRSGSATVSIAIANMAAHTHPIGEKGEATRRFQAKPSSQDIGIGGNGYTYLTSTGNSESDRSPIANSVGGSQPLNVRNPFVAFPYIIKAV